MGAILFKQRDIPVCVELLTNFSKSMALASEGGGSEKHDPLSESWEYDKEYWMGII